MNWKSRWVAYAWGRAHGCGVFDDDSYRRCSLCGRLASRLRPDRVLHSAYSPELGVFNVCRHHLAEFGPEGTDVQTAETYERLPGNLPPPWLGNLRERLWHWSRALPRFGRSMVANFFYAVAHYAGKAARRLSL